MEIQQRHAAWAHRAIKMHDCIQRRERHAHVRRKRRDTMLGRAEDRVIAAEAVDGIAAGSGITFVAS
jgi:hypothetical protein